MNFVENYFVEDLRTAAFENGSSKSNSTVENLSKFGFFPYRRAGSLVTLFDIQEQYFTTSILVSVGIFVFVLDYHHYMRLYLIFQKATLIQY